MPQYQMKNIDTDKVKTIRSDETILKALEITFQNRFHQLAVESDRRIVGMISFESLARAIKISDQIKESESIVNLPVEIAAEDPGEIVPPDENLFNLFDYLVNSFYVLVDYRGDGYHIINPGK